MLSCIIDFSLRHRFLIILLAAAGAAVGAVSLRYLDIDAFPDTTPVQVQINTVAPSLAPEEVEQRITFPIEQVLSGLPGIQQLRSVSKFGLSQVVVTFEDATNIYFARQVINERLGTVELPAGIVRPKMGPVATGLGEVFHYVVTLKGVDLSKLSGDKREERLQYLHTVHDWVIKPKLRTVRGVAEVNSWGGFEKQYQVRIDPDRLIKHCLTFDQVTEAVEKNNKNVGGGSIRQNSQMLLVHGPGPHGQRRPDQEHCCGGQRRGADPCPRRGGRGSRSRDPPRGGHCGWQRRSGARPGFYAHGREQPCRHPRPQEKNGGHQVNTSLGRANPDSLRSN
jgi:cobalt-zinc-cadmium resistance protein CzcA